MSDDVKKKKAQNKTKKQDDWQEAAPFGWHFYFMVVGTQDKGHKVSNVQVMPLLLGALPFEEVCAVRQ